VILPLTKKVGMQQPSSIKRQFIAKKVLRYWLELTNPPLKEIGKLWQDFDALF